LSERSKEYQLPSGTSFTLFSDLATSLQATRTITSDADRSYRYRTVETIIPLRNVVLAQ
jgi:hypothetical protein